MLIIEIHLSHSPRVLSSLLVTGHASSLLCGAVSFLCRTLVHVLTLNRDVAIEYTMPQEGMLNLSVTSVSASAVVWLSGITDMLVAGAQDVAAEHPSEINLNITNA